MTGEIIQDDGIAGTQRRDELLLDLSEENVSVPRPIDDQWGSHASGSQRANKRCCLPVAVGNFAYETLASKGSSIAPSHLGVGSRFVEKNKTVQMQMCLPETPCRSPLGHVGAILFSGMQDLF